MIGVEMHGEARAYPLRILVWHEIVNDAIGTNAFSVTYCPLCGSSMVFDRNVEGRRLEFGVSGLLYQSDVLMYDRETESLWSQLRQEAVSGPLAGKRLRLMEAEHSTFAAWQERHPDGRVLSTDTGFERQYGYMPYGNYERVEDVMFPIARLRPDLKNKERVAGVVVGGQSFAIVLGRLKAGGESVLSHNGEAVTVSYEPKARYLRVWRVDTKLPMPHAPAYWFAWQAFHPATWVWPEE